MSFRFVVDKIIKGRPYPALSEWEARPYTPAWREFDRHWPWTIPLRIEEYCRQHKYPIELFDLNSFPDGCWYPIGLSFFDYTIDYIALLPKSCRTAVQQRRLRLLFMYHEGDNPARIKQQLDSQCQRHALEPDCYVFVSSNTAADQLERFVHFHDFELWYHQLNKNTSPVPVNTERTKDFLCLNRIHKIWRASIMADLHHLGVLDNSVWSYCNVVYDTADENPLQTDLVPGLKHRTEKFIDSAPYHADDLPDNQRNDHSHFVPNHFQDTFCNIVTESQLDVDQSGGVFLTEKTFKPIKHAQMFFIAGAAGSLDQLRRMGYRVFDHALDNSYDGVQDATSRWLKLRDAIQQAHVQGMRLLYQKCLKDILHNQQLFLTAPIQRLTNLDKKLEYI